MNLATARHRLLGGDRARFLLASLLGSVAALLVFGLLLTRGEPNLLEWQRSGDFYDAQARSFLDGTWEVDGGVLSIERFESRGGTYMYQGPWPALLRVPVVAVTERYDGRLTQLSMLLALGVGLAGTTRLHWRVRRLARPAAPLRIGELIAAGGVTFAVGAGSALLFEASRAWVYHEAALWGAAWAIVATDGVVGCVQRPTRSRLLWAALATAAALTSRGSVGVGPAVALGILAGGNLVSRVRDHLGDKPPAGFLRHFRWAAGAPRRDGTLPVVGPALAGLAPIGVYAAINWIKFRSLFSIPFYGQGFTMGNPARQQFLAVNDGTLFGLKWVPTTAVQYLRPDALRLTRTFPFVDFPPPARPFSGVTFDLVDYTSSVPASMPLLTILAVVGMVALLRRSPAAPGHGVAALRIPVLGALAGALTILPFAYIANRYLADTVPLLVVAGLVGLQVVLRRAADAPASPGRTLVNLGMVALLLVGLWVNLSHGLVFQRLYSPNVKDDVAAGFLDTRYDVPQSLGIDLVIPIRDDEALPLDAPRGQLAIVGDCTALYLADGMPNNAVKPLPWNPVERSEAGGRFLRRATFPIQPPGTRQPLLTMTSSEGDGALWVEWQGGAGVGFGFTGPGRGTRPSRTHFIPPGRVGTLDLVADPRMHFLQVWFDDELLFEGSYQMPLDTVVTVGTDAIGDPALDDAFSGQLEPLPERTRVCRELQREAGLAEDQTGASS